jgi:Dihydroorotate dehydrogenase
VHPKKTGKRLFGCAIRRQGADLIECSFSCPQGSMGEEPGKMLAQSIEATEKVTRWVKEAADTTPVLIKITPQVTDIVEVAKAVKRGGADGITASNTIPSLLGVDIYTF